MSEEAKEPRTFEDLWLMRETSKEWFNGQLKYENVRNGADPEVGMVDSLEWCVEPSSNCVRVCKNTHVISEVSLGGHSLSLRVEREVVAEYESMRAFRASEWWDLAMEGFAGGDADASWLRTVELDSMDVYVDPVWIGYGPSVTLFMEVGNRYRDWLGNRRQGKGHSSLDIRVDRMSGTLSLHLDGHDVEGTVEEIEAAMTLAERLRGLGVEFGDGTITVPLLKNESEVDE